ILSGLLEVIPIIRQEFQIATRFIVASQLSRTFLLFFAALLFGSVRALLYAAITHALLLTIAVLWYLYSRLPGFWRHFDPELLCPQLLYAVPSGFAGLLWTIQSDLHNYFVSHQFGAAVFAVYSIGCLQIPLMGLLNEAAGSVMIPRISELEMRNETHEMIRLS